MADEQIFGFNVLVSRSYYVTVKAKSRNQANEAFDAGEIQTSDIHERGSLNHVEIDTVESAGTSSDIDEADFDVTDYVMNSDYDIDEPEEPPHLTNSRGEKIFVGDRVVSTSSTSSCLMFNDITRKNEIVLSTEALLVTELFDDILYNFMTLKINDGRVFRTVQPRNFTPLCETCSGAGIGENDVECPVCLGTGTPPRNMP